MLGAAMTEFDIEVSGPFSAQPLLVKMGSLMAFVAFVVFASFIPTSLAIAVIMGVGTPAPNWMGTAVALTFSGAMAAFGAWLNCRFLSWLRGSNLDFRAGCLFVSATICVSATIASVAAMLGAWPEMFLSAGSLALVCLFSSSVFTTTGKTLSGTTKGL